MEVVVLLLATCLAVLAIKVSAQGFGASLGFREDTEIAEGSRGGDICAGAVLLMQDDGDFENGYAWSSFGVVAPEYGAWAECYDSGFVCGVQFFFTQTGDQFGQTVDVYVWESQLDGNPPPGPDPGNVACILPDIDPGLIAFWPEVSVHNIRVCCEIGGSHFVGFWPNWPGQGNGWFVAADEDSPGIGCPRTKIAPGIGYPTGWTHPNIVHTFRFCKDLGIREYSGLGDCQATPTQATTWGLLRALY